MTIINLQKTRTGNSLANSFVALGVYFFNLILQFFSRKYFIDYLGPEVLGLNTTATSLLQFLNLAELGVGAAVTFTLYKPLAKKDYKTVNEIVALQGWLYRNIAIIIIVCSAVLMCFFPMIFSKMQLPLWYAYASFAVLLFSSLLGYFINYKQIVLTANQQEYKIQLSYKIVLLIKILAQIFAIKFFNNGYIWWLTLEFCFAIFASVTLNFVIKKSFPFMKIGLSQAKLLKNKYPDVLTKIKQFFFHKFAGFVLTQTSPIIIYAYINLTMVAIYGNYMIVVNGVLAMLNAIFNSMAASVGNLVAEGKKENIMCVFRELFSARFFIVSVLAFSIYVLLNPFMILWVGEEYLMDMTTILLIVTIFFLNTTRSVVDSFINALGLYRDIWAPLVEASLNLGLSVLLGYFFGIHGILLGVLISLLIIVFTWKPYFLFSQGLHEPIGSYITIYTKHILCLGVSVLITFYFLKLVPIDPTSSWSLLLVYSIITVLSIITILGLALYLTEDGMRMFIRRLLNILKYAKG
ncbi:MAG: sugar transporter [Bacteroidales bacterium]|nr:sugar transporter [Bacteroidales bacterium]MDD3944733.1 sugar transporter [Bacteroidales bacterium]